MKGQEVMLRNPRWDPAFPKLETELEVTRSAVFQKAKGGDGKPDRGTFNHCDFSTRTWQTMTSRCERLWRWWYRHCHWSIWQAQQPSAVTISVKAAATIRAFPIPTATIWAEPNTIH